MNKKITDKEKKVLIYLVKYFGKHGYMPTREEIANGVKYDGKNPRQVMQYFLRSLESKGKIVVGKGWRNITIKSY